MFRKAVALMIWQYGVCEIIDLLGPQIWSRHSQRYIDTISCASEFTSCKSGHVGVLLNHDPNELPLRQLREVGMSSTLRSTPVNLQQSTDCAVLNTLDPEISNELIYHPQAILRPPHYAPNNR